MTEWMAASIAKWQNFTYFIKDEKKQSNLQIMMNELQFHTIRDLLSIIETFYEMKR